MTRYDLEAGAASDIQWLAPTRIRAHALFLARCTVRIIRGTFILRYKIALATTSHPDLGPLGPLIKWELPPEDFDGLVMLVDRVVRRAHPASMWRQACAITARYILARRGCSQSEAVMLALGEGHRVIAWRRGVDRES